MVSLIWDKRAILLSWVLLPKLGYSNLGEQKTVLKQVFPVLKEYKIAVLGDREFCSVELGNWPRQEQVYFCLRLKLDVFIQLESQAWVQLSALGLSPGVSLYFQGVKVTKTK